MCDILLKVEEVTAMFIGQAFIKEQLVVLCKFNKEQLQAIDGSILKNSTPAELEVMRTFSAETLREANKRLLYTLIAESAPSLIKKFAVRIEEERMIAQPQERSPISHQLLRQQYQQSTSFKLRSVHTGSVIVMGRVGIPKPK